VRLDASKSVPEDQARTRLPPETLAESVTLKFGTDAGPAEWVAATCAGDNTPFQTRTSSMEPATSGSANSEAPI